MADNQRRYGLRWNFAANGKAHPQPIECFVDTLESFDVSGGGAANCFLRAGDVVRRKGTGGMEQADGAEATAEAAYGVVVGIGPYWDGTRMWPAKELPSDVSYGTLLERQSKLLVVPVDAGIWEVDANATLTDEAAWQATVGANCSLILTGTTGEKYLDPMLATSSIATTNTLLWRIHSISKTRANHDFTGLYVKVNIEPNIAQRPWSSTTGV
jgi:hypothetical protein